MREPDTVKVDRLGKVRSLSWSCTEAQAEQCAETADDHADALQRNRAPDERQIATQCRCCAPPSLRYVLNQPAQREASNHAGDDRFRNLTGRVRDIAHSDPVALNQPTTNRRKQTRPS